MDIKPRPNHAIYLQALRNMTPEQRLEKAIELTETANDLFLHGLRTRFPDANEAEIRQIYLKRLARCHNQNY